MNIQRDAAELAKVSINVNESAWRTRGAVEEKKKEGQMPRDGIRIRIEQPRRRWIIFHGENSGDPGWKTRRNSKNKIRGITRGNSIAREITFPCNDLSSPLSSLLKKERKKEKIKIIYMLRDVGSI